MKLKRFLLRYDPPGVGFEVQGEERIRHRDVPPKAEVTSAKDVKRIVDELITEESEMLTRRKHRPALIQLLARLYEVTVEPDEEDEDGKSKKKQADSANVSSEAEIQEGQVVVLISLKGKLQEHNGAVGTVVKSKADKDKFEVLLSGQDQGEPLKVKGAEHIVPVAPKGTDLVRETYVVIRGLRNHIELNGCLGRVSECTEEKQRFEVRAVESGQLFRVKQDNLLAVSPLEIQKARGRLEASKENGEPNAGAAKKSASTPTASSSPQLGAGGDFEVFETGSIVQLHSLKTAMVYNGQNAEVLSADRVRGRYEISLADGSVKTIRAENVRLVSAPSSKRKAKESKTNP